MYCWGSCSNGELGLGGIEDEHVLLPRQLQFNHVSEAVQLSCGVNHTLALLSDGSVYSCGLNEFGQLGHQKGFTRLEKIDKLVNQVIKQVSAGLSHSLALNEWGQIFAWGLNNYGQLGIGKQTDDSNNVSTPKMVKSLATLQVIQIVAGYEHSLALTSSGDIYAWGSNSYGQLGIGTNSLCVEKPVRVSSLCGVPIFELSAGANHSFALSVSGTVFGWGKNSMGQLGVEDRSNKLFPVHLKFLRSQKIKKISCGEEHTVALTIDGRLFTWGAGTSGQLGFKPSSNQNLPRQVLELMGTSLSQIATGRRHTLAYGADSQRLYAFGLGGSGQLGINQRLNKFNPVVVQGPWNDGPHNAEDQCTSMRILHVFAGGSQSFVMVTCQSIQDNRGEEMQGSRLLCFTDDIIEQLISYGEKDSIALERISLLETVLSSMSCLNSSYLQANNSHYPCTIKNHGIDLSLAQSQLAKMTAIRHPRIIELIAECVMTVVHMLPTSPPDTEALRLYLLLPLFPMFTKPEKYLESLIIPFVNCVNNLKPEALRVLLCWWGLADVAQFESIVGLLKKAIVHTLVIPHQAAPCINTRKYWLANLLQLLGRLHQVSLDNGGIISHDKFYIPEITEKVNVKADYIHWRLEQGQGHGQAVQQFYFCDFAFVFDPPAKALLLQTDAALQMQNAMDEAYFRNSQNLLINLFNPENPYLILQVERHNIVHNTLRQLQLLTDITLKKPLKVIFRGEEAVDQGGVRKEFFLLLMKEILDPKFGMFTRSPETYNIWFCDKTYEDDEMFYLVGIVCGLAIYNFTIIDLPFPLVLYKKLLNRTTKLDDLNGLSPSMVKGLQQLINYEEPDIQDVFCLSFEVTQEHLGQVFTEELKANGKNISVDQSNKAEYVDLLVEFMLNKSVKKQYDAFHRGFHRVCGGRVIELFQPEELMEMVIGNQNYDWHALQANTEYKPFYTVDHPVIVMFWKVFHSLDEVQKKKFLLFLTGSDRIPILGIKAVQLIIQPMMVNDDYMPVAHTCFNLLDLPAYSSEQNLRHKLLQAIEHTQGFGLA